jgi:cytochrome c553
LTGIKREARLKSENWAKGGEPGKASMKTMGFAWAVMAAGTAAMMAMPAARAQDSASASETVRRAIHVCSACHGENGRSKVAATPSLAGQQAQYLQQQLKDFRSQTRSEANQQAYMWGVSALLDDNAIAGLAEYYAAQTPAPGIAGPKQQVAAGRQIYAEGLPLQDVKACADCHGAQAQGAAGFPRLAGQHADYLTSQLRLFKKTPLRPHGVLMKGELRAMSDAQMRAVAVYLQSL